LLNETFQRALKYYYANKLETDEDRNKIEELIRNVACTQKKTESKRKGLDRKRETEDKQELIDEIKKVKGDIPDWLLEGLDEEIEIPKVAKIEGELGEQLDRAREIMGEREFMGPNEIKKAFGIEIPESEIPPIPFSVQELKKAKELNQFLVLRIDTTQDGQSLTMLKMHEILSEDFSKKGAGDVLYSTAGWKEKESFFTDGVPKAQWALTSKKIIEDSNSKNYLEQSLEIAEYLEREVFSGIEMPDEYKEAISELKDKKEELAKLIETDDRSKYEPELSKLKINKFTRQSPVETLYDILIYFQNNDERLLEDKYAWTHTAASDGYRVNVGYFDSDGACVSWDSDGRSGSDLGVVFSRNF